MTELQTADAPQPRRKAYSYLRFSTPEQSQGNSFKRQTSLAAAYAARHGLDLDDELTFHDLGVSGFRQQNVETGRLGYFLEAVRSGQVASGSVLLVEQLDRLSRLSPRRALRVLESIVDEGVSVVTLNDEREYTSASLDSDPTDLLISILTFTRANEESETKSRRLKAAWEAKRSDIASGKPLTSKVPAWLKLSVDRSGFEVIEERADLVRRIFAMTLHGVGQNKIAATLNQEGHTPWGRGKFWHRSYVAKMLANPAVIGTFHPHMIEYDGSAKRRKPLEPVEGYFPAIVPEETFREVQALKQALGSPQRGRHANAPITNILAGLAACHKCGGSMTRVAKGNRSKPMYVCTRAKGGAGCQYKTVRCDVIEYALMRGLPERLQDLEGATGKDAGLDQAIEAATATVDALQETINVLVDSLSYGKSAAVMQRLQERDSEMEEAQAALRKLQERQASATGLTVRARVDRVLEALQPTEGAPSVSEINRALRTIFRKAVIDWTTGRIDLEWTHGGTCTVHFPTFTKWPAQGGYRYDEEHVHED